MNATTQARRDEGFAPTAGSVVLVVDDGDADPLICLKRSLEGARKHQARIKRISDANGAGITTTIYRLTPVEDPPNAGREALPPEGLPPENG